MAKPFDATAKELLEKHPQAWLEFLLGRKLGEVRVVDAELSTTTFGTILCACGNGLPMRFCRVTLRPFRLPRLPVSRQLSCRR